MFTQKQSKNPLGGLLMMILFIVIVYFFFKALFWVLGIATPIMVILTLFINYKVYPEYLQMIINLFKRSPIMGIATGALTFFAFPLVAAFLLAKALFFKKINKVHEDIRKKEEKEYVEYEEVEDDVILEDEPLDLKEIEKMKEARGNTATNEYDDLFKD